jgi:hypothetical protein
MLDLISTSSDLVHNEWAKLVATFFNNSAVAAFVGGVVTPIFADKPKFMKDYPVLGRGGIFVLGVALAVLFHFIARASLSTLHSPP